MRRLLTTQAVDPMTRVWLRLAGVLLLFAPLHTHAAATWTLAASAHFDVYASGGEKRARAAVEYLEHVDGFFEHYLALPTAARPHVRVIVFDGEREYAPYRPSAAATAFYQSAYGRDVIVLRDIDADSSPIVVHEYAHLALGRIGAQFPPWLGEGLAEFFSTISTSGTRTAVGRAPDGRLAVVKRAQLLPTSRLVAVTQASPEYNSPAQANVFYAQSWALTHMLIVDDRYRAGSQKFINLVANGTPTIDALGTVYGKTLATIDEDLRQYVSRLAFNFYYVDYAQAENVRPPAISAVSAIDSAIVLAEPLAAQRGRETQARTAFAALERTNGGYAPLLEAFGLFERRTGHSDESEALFSRAAQHGSHAALVYSAFFNAKRLLAQQQSLEAVSLLNDITDVPESLAFEYFQVAANAQFAQGNLQSAADAAVRVVEHASTMSEVKFAEDLMRRVGGPPDMTRIISGRLRRLACDAALPVLEVETSAGLLRLAIDDRAKVLVAGGVLNIDLKCGAFDTPLKVGYSVADPPASTNGRLRFLDLR